MAQPIIPGVNIAGQAEAMAGAQSLTFTATDRQLIKELAGEIDKTRNFKELFFSGDLSTKVENEESTAKPGTDIQALESRREQHREMLKHAAITFHKEQVRLSDQTKAEVVVAPAVKFGRPPQPEIVAEPDVIKARPAMRSETAQIVKELNLDPAALFNKFTLDQEDLHNLIHKVRELHLKRLLCTSQNEFKFLTEEIRTATLASSRPESKDWLEREFSKLTCAAAVYKLNLIRAMQSLHYDDENDPNTRWLQQEIKKYS